MPAAPPSRWKRRIRWILVVLLLSPVVILALVNALFATPWAKGYIGRKLSARLGVETSVGKVTFTPWGGFTIADLRCLQPLPLRNSLKSPLIEVREIRIHPQWNRLLHGDLALAAVRIDRPRLMLSLEMAASLVSAGTAEPVTTAVAATPPPPVASAEAPVVSGHTPPQAVAPSTPSSAPPAPLPDSATIGTAWLEIVDGEGELWLSGTRLLSFRGGEGKIPFAGAPAFSKLQLRKLELLDHELGHDLSLPLSWRAPELRSSSAEFQLADLEVKLSAAVGVMPGVPFGIDMVLPKQPVHGGQWLESIKPEAAQLEARLQGVGLMRHPSTWQGLAAASAESVTMQIGDQAMEFDEGRATFALQGGVLQSPDVRLTSERVSFLGNGQIRADGQGTAVLRVVVPPDTAAAWTKRLTIGEQAPVFAPLETPDRMFIDLRWISYSGGQGVELGAGGPVVPPAALMKLLADG